MEINYQIKDSLRAKKIRINVYPDGSVVVTKPRRIPKFVAEEFARRNSNWILKKIEYQKNRKKIILPENLKSRQEALNFVMNRINFFNQHYKFGFNKVSIKNHKNLWGSCSAKKNLNFNSKITHLSQVQADYIIVHELCHLKEMNHSQRFWDLVGETIPNHKEIRKDLKQYLFQ